LRRPGDRTRSRCAARRIPTSGHKAQAASHLESRRERALRSVTETLAPYLAGIPQPMIRGRRQPVLPQEVLRCVPRLGQLGSNRWRRHHRGAG
jgi:hypothetical protein